MGKPDPVEHRFLLCTRADESQARFQQTAQSLCVLLRHLLVARQTNLSSQSLRLDDPLFKASELLIDSSPALRGEESSLNRNRTLTKPNWSCRLVWMNGLAEKRNKEPVEPECRFRLDDLEQVRLLPAISSFRHPSTAHSHKGKKREVTMQ
jgi:hypothetical protein